MNEQEELIKRLSFENLIWIVYIAVAIFNIYGDELIKRSIRNNDMAANRQAKKIFLVILSITAIIYLYFLARNYSDLKKHSTEKAYRVRFLGSILLLIGILCFLYFQLSITREENSISNI